ncbi:10499_t:CDS:2, partial [Racocetra persica]
EYEEDVVLTSQEVNVPPSATYGCKPAREESGVIQCNSCLKKLFASGFVEHTENCEKIKAKFSISTKKMHVDEIPVNKNMKNIESIANAYVPNKKRKRSVTSEGPIDLDKQCGVVEHTGMQCSRSLTCKSHSMALKRAVQGRSQPFNTLLSQYPKKSIDNGVPDNKPENSKKDGSIVEVDEKDDGVVDSDEEVDAVMEAIMCSKPQPLVTRPESYVPPTSNYFIYNDLLPE